MQARQSSFLRTSGSPTFKYQNENDNIAVEQPFHVCRDDTDLHTYDHVETESLDTYKIPQLRLVETWLSGKTSDADRISIVTQASIDR